MLVMNVASDGVCSIYLYMRSAGVAEPRTVDSTKVHFLNFGPLKIPYARGILPVRPGAFLQALRPKLVVIGKSSTRLLSVCAPL